MKKFLSIFKLEIFVLVITLLMGLSSCKKQNTDRYEKVPETTEQTDTTDWRDDYVDGGVLPTGTNSGNVLMGTTWVLTKYLKGFATEYPNDTIFFETNTKYRLNSGGQRNYFLGSIPASTNYDLTLYFFAPFNGSHYSAQVGQYFVDDGEINGAVFRDIQNSNEPDIRAWMEKQ